MLGLIKDMDKQYYNRIASLFSLPFIKLVANNKHQKKLYNFLEKTGYINIINERTSLVDLFDLLYKDLKNNYRSEYVYKNAIADKILLGKHSIYTSTLISEFRVEGRKADIVVVNGTSTVYEIKTELDTLNRLDGQLEAYKKVFDKIYIVTDENSVEKVKDSVKKDIGILVLSRRYSFKEHRKALSNIENVDPACIFRSLRQKEYLNILKKYYNYEPDVPNTLLYEKCLKLFKELTPTIAHQEMVNELKKRSYKKEILNLIKVTPKSLKALCVDYRLSKKEILNLEKNLLLPAFQ